MITSGTHDGKSVDTSTDAEINALIEAYRRIRPREIMIYTIDRPTPEGTMRRVSSERLREIGERITAATGIPVQVTT